jgi:hypothetical protein
VSPIGSSSIVDIVLPYSAFDLTVSAPIVPTATRYFPLRRANNDTQYVIGRTFFQEAYIIADYERKNFSVSQCNWTPNQVQQIVSILPPSNSTTIPSKDNKKISKTVISSAAAGGAILLILTCILLEFYYLKPRRKRKNIAELEALGTANPLNDPDILKPELYGSSTPIISPDIKPEILTPPIEIGENNPVFELPAREEVAFEMSNQVNRRFSARGYRKHKNKRGAGAGNGSEVGASERVSLESPIVGRDYLLRTMASGVSPVTTDLISPDTGTETNFSWASSPEPTFSTPLMGHPTPLPKDGISKTRSPG